jgi:predicted ATPase
LISAGYARAQLGAVAEGFAQAEAGFAQWRAAAGPHLLTFIAPPMAELYALAGRAAAAGALIDEALASIAASGEHVGQVELHRVRAELLRRAGARGAAEAELQGALAVARAQAAKMLELRVATALARLWRDAGRAADARALVGGLYAWFTEGFDTADLRAAQALIGST